MMICIERATLDDHAVLRIQDFSSLLSSGTQAPLYIFHRHLEDDVLAMANHRLQADGFSYLSGICAFLPLTHTPPQVDIFTCNYLRRKTRVDVVGRGKRRICSLLITLRSLAFSPSKTRAASFPGFVASDSKRDSASHRLFYRSMLYQKDRPEVACFVASLISLDVFVLKRVLFPLGDKFTYIQRCTCPAGSQRKSGNRSTMDRCVFRALDRSVTEGGQEKDGKRPEPKKQKKQKPEREGDKREGDKGKRKGKSPRTEELISSIMQKSEFLSFTHPSPNLLDCFGFER